MKTHCRPHKTLFSLLTFCTFASFNGCDTQTNVVQTPPATPEINAAVQLQNEANEQELKNKKEEEEAKKQAEEAEINAMLKRYERYIRTDQYKEIKKLNYQEAKKYISDLVIYFKQWEYTKPSESAPKGKCVINSQKFGDVAPIAYLLRDELLDPVILVIPGMLANGSTTIQLQIDDRDPESVNYSNQSGLILKLTEKQYNDISNSVNSIKIIIIKPESSAIIDLETGNINNCIRAIESSKLGNWEYNVKVNSFDDTTIKFCAGESYNKVYARFKLDYNGDRTESPVLVIRQKNHKLPEIILSSNGIQWPPYWQHKIRLRFDDEKPISTSYTSGAGSVTMIFLNSEKKLLQKLFSSKRVMFQMPNSSETFSFDLTELPETCAELDLSAIKK